ncbi:MAG: peptidoglycan DD-metalloendopeptidase family protein [Actinomycetia bacterium]|nr:peptidoglycan DD-metalloendopeptidase family protein [Actinomycetes bacterium]
MKLQNPWPEGYSINKNSPFGNRIHPISGKKKFHNGVDVAGSFPVTVAADGVVKKIGWSPKGGGHTVLIDHGEIVTVYYHGAHRTALKKGQKVSTGDFIYTAGSTGASTGSHLHFEVRNRGGRWGDVLDPELFLSGRAPKPVNKVSGKLDKATWKQWQTALKDGGYMPGRIDGRPGRMTYGAIQRWAGVKDDGVLGPNTRRAVQRKLGVKVDGDWGRLTISELQRQLNRGDI